MSCYLVIPEGAISGDLDTIAALEVKLARLQYLEELVKHLPGYPSIWRMLSYARFW